MNTSFSSTTLNAMNNHDGIIHFPISSRVQPSSSRGWICNISKQYVFSQQHHEYLQIKSSCQHSQFDLICKLLEANTCRVIYFDEQLSPEQLTHLRNTHYASRAELIHAKLAFLFAKDVTTISA